MADSEALYGAIDKRPGVRYTALWLNKRGFERAAATPGVDLDGKILFYTTDAFSRLNNNCTAAEMQARQRDWLGVYDRARRAPGAGLHHDRLRLQLRGRGAAVGHQRRGALHRRGVPRAGPRVAGDLPRRHRRLGQPGSDQAPRRRCPRGRARGPRRPPSARHARPGRGQLLCRPGDRCRLVPTPRSPASAAVPSPPTRIPVPPATSVPRTWCSCATSSASRPGIELEKLIEAARLVETVIGRSLAGPHHAPAALSTASAGKRAPDRPGAPQPTMV